MTSLPKTVCLLAAILVAGHEPRLAAAQSERLAAGDAAIRQALGRDCPVIKLWPSRKTPDEPPTIGAESVTDAVRGRPVLRISNVSRPTLTVIAPAPASNSGAALLLAPDERRGVLQTLPVLALARRLNARGATAVLLKHRTSPPADVEASRAALQDMQRALNILRGQADQWGLDPRKIALGGCGIGGRRAAALSTDWRRQRFEPVDALDETPRARPAATVMLDPAGLSELLDSPNSPLGRKATEISLANTPPTFIGAGASAAAGCLRYYRRLRAAGVPGELHVYPDAEGDERKTPGSADELQRWLADLKLVEGPPPPQPFTYRAKTLPDSPPANERLTNGDQRMLHILGRSCPVIPLWPDAAPDETLAAGPETVTHRSRGGNALNITNVTRPTITIVAPPAGGRPRRTVLVCPGGAYQGLAAEHEGLRVCQWLNEHGMTGVLLKYRVPRRGGTYAKHHHAWQDAQRALRLLRNNARRWAIDPQQLGVCGFSAGGHLCATLCTRHDTNAYEPLDIADRASCRPDFAILVYPAYLSEPVDSDDLDPAFRGRLKRNESPPIFLAAARDDRFTRGMLSFLQELQKANVPSECHVYARGGHGGGIDPDSYPFSEWTKPCLHWLRQLGEPTAGRQPDKQEGE